MSYKAYRDSDGNYDIRSSKDDAMYGVGALIGWIIGYTILLPFVLYDKITYKNGTLLGTDKDNFIISIGGHQQKYLIKSLEFVHYGFKNLTLKFKDEKKIIIFKGIPTAEVIKELEPLYDLLDEKKVIVTLHATNEVNEWFEKYLKGETKKTPVHVEKVVNQSYKKMYKIINGNDMQELEINTQDFLDTLGINVKEIQIGTISKVDNSYCQNISYLQGC